MGLFRKSAQEPLAVTIAGVKLGQRLLGVGTRDPKLIARLAIKAGLTGRACIVDVDERALASAAAVIEQEGALVEAFLDPFGSWSFADSSFDVAVIPDLLPTLKPDLRVRCVEDVLRVLRPGGRVLVVERAPRGGLAGVLLGTANQTPSYEGAVHLLSTSGFAAVRQLAATDGATYVEGIKKA